jgi:hypothetical protein
MQRVQLYVEDTDSNLQLVDLFQDESIQVTSTIQDIRDIGKVFTDYSQTFNVPASDTNNKIFRHFYNYYITNGAYDSRKKKRAEIHINYMPFRRGKIFLNDVKMKGNKAYSYNITFYGETVSLKDLIGDDELTDLSYLTNYNHSYTNLQVQSGFEAGIDFVINSNLQEKAIIYPLITSKKRLFFNSDIDSNIELNSTGNLYHDSSNPDTERGLEFTDLKPAIRTIHIIEAIESQYNINFTRDFFDSSAFSNLYLWLNNVKGNYNEEKDLFIYDVESSNYSVDTSYSPYSLTNTDISEITFESDIMSITKSSSYDYQIGMRADFTPNWTGGAFQTIFIECDALGNTIQEYVIPHFLIGYNTFLSFYRVFESTDPSGTKHFKFRIKSKDILILTTPRIFGIKYNTGVSGGQIEVYSDTNVTPDGITTSIDIDLNRDLFMPKIKIIDFLTGIFKMFNLTAYFIDDVSDPKFGQIYVDTLDNYYGDAVNNKLGATIDIDKYLDTTEHAVGSILPFTDIEFKYKENQALLMRQHEEAFNEVFGDAEFNVRRNFPNEIDRGTKYEIKIPFVHLKYERLINGSLESQDFSSGAGDITGQTSLQWGYSAGGEFNPDTSVTPPTGDYDSLNINPLLFYGILEENLPSDDRINWIYEGDTPVAINSYWRPSNSNEAGSTTVAPEFTLNFDQEFDEWNGVDYSLVDNQESASLYNKFYKNYVEGVFNVAKRVFKVTAYLPPNILVNYKLNNQIKIQDQMFRINSITTELTTGKSELELLNIFSQDIVE